MKRAVVLLCSGLLLLAGCGDRPGYDASAVQKYLRTSQGWRFTGAEVGAATCPAHRELSEGMTVRCTIAVSGSKVPFVVTLDDVHTDRVKVSAKPDGVIIPGNKLTQVVATSLPAEARTSKVECGSGSAFVVAKVGSRIACSVVLGSQSQTFHLTVRDATGRVAISS